MIHHADDSTFEAQVLAVSGPVFVEFFTPSCGPCRQIDPHLQSLAQKYSGRIKFVKVNSEQSLEIANRYRIEVAPTFIIFLRGQPVQIIQGAPPPHRLRSFILPYIS